MARETLVIAAPTLQAGVIITAATGTAGTADGHEFKWARDVSLKYENTGAAIRTVTIPVAKTTVSGTPFDPLVHTLQIGESLLVPPVEAAPFVWPDTGMVHLDFEGAVEAEVNVTAIKLKNAA